MTPLLLTVPAAARYLGIGQRAVALLAAEGRIPCVPIGRRRYVPREALDALTRPETDAATAARLAPVLMIPRGRRRA